MDTVSLDKVSARQQQRQLAHQKQGERVGGVYDARAEALPLSPHVLWASSPACERRQRARQAFQAIVNGEGQALMRRSVLARQQGEEREAAETGRYKAQRKQARCD